MTGDPLRTIYTDIIQPLIGDFFEVDAALPPIDGIPNSELINDDNDDEELCLCCAPRPYQSTPVSDRGGSVRSDGKFYIYFKRKIHIGNLIIILIFFSQLIEIQNGEIS